MATTGQGPAWMTVTGVSCPVSSSKTWVMPSFRPTIPFTPCSFRRESRTTRTPRVGTLEAEGGPRWPRAVRPLGRESRASELDLDVHAGREIQPHQGVDRLRRRRVDVDQALVRAHLEVLTGVLVLERAPDHRVDVLLGGQGHRPGHGRAGALRRLDDRERRSVELGVVVPLEADADLLLRQGSVLPRYFWMSVTTPAPTVRPPSRMAKRRPWSMAIGWMSSMSMFVLSPGMTISWPSGRLATPVTSVVRK